MLGLVNPPIAHAGCRADGEHERARWVFAQSVRIYDRASTPGEFGCVVRPIAIGCKDRQLRKAQRSCVGRQNGAARRPLLEPYLGFVLVADQ